MKRFAVTGGRGYSDAQRVRRALSAIYRKHGPFVLVHGACNCDPSAPGYGRGADFHASMWVKLVAGVIANVWEEPHPADWSKGLSAGPARNADMAKSGLDGCVAFPGGRGTDNMVAACIDAGVPVWDLRGTA